MRDILLDIVKHTNGLGFIEACKIQGTDEETKIEAMDVDRTVMMYGELHKPEMQLSGISGAGNLGFLNWLLTWEYLNDDGSTIDVKREERNSHEQPVELKFLGSAGAPWHYRFMSGALVEEQLKTVKFRGADWDVQFTPSHSSILLFNSAAAGIMAFEPYFSLSTKGGQLSMGFGTGGNSHRGELAFANNVNGTLKNTYYWPIAQVMAILRLASSGTCTMSVADVGALEIKVDSGLGTYSYVLPAKS